MKRVPIFKLSTSTLFQQDHKLDVLTHGLTSIPTIVSSSNNSTDSNIITSPPTTPNKNITAATTTTATTDNSILSTSPSNTTFDHFCNTCLLRFTDKEIRNVHYRSGLHRYNLNLRLSHLQPVTEEDYNILLENIKSHDNGEGSEDSEGSDNGSSSEDDYDSSDEEYLLKKNKVSENPDQYDEEYYYKTFQGYQFYDNSVEMNDPKLKIVQKDLKLQLSVWKCLLGPPSLFRQIANEGKEKQVQLLDTLVKNFKQYVLAKDLKWVVLLCSGGRFAGAVYSGGKCIEHKTYTRYTIRMGQGGSQSKADSSKTIKSGGSSIRRYNEKRLKEEVAELLESWKDHFKQPQCTHIFVFAPKGNTRDILFPPGSFLSVDDERIRTIPFPIIRPTFSEAQRVSTWISSVDIELFDEEKLELERKEQEKKLKERQDKFDHEQRLKEKEKRRKEFELQNSQAVAGDEDDDEGPSEYEMNPLFTAVKEKDLERVKYLLEKDESFEMPLPNEEKKEMFISPLFLAIDNSDLKMCSYLLKYNNSDVNLLNPRWDFITPLHKASMKGDCLLVELLLNNGADPTLSGGLNVHVPYDCSADQKTRDKFREWAGDHLEDSSCNWDFSKAHIVPLTKQMKQEKEEKKKQKRKQQREKDKVKKQNEKQDKLDQQEQDKLKQDKIEELKLVEQLQRSKLSADSKLSDREKRALAAERRTAGAGATGFKSCDNCHHPIIGTPFERLTYSYCNTQCVLMHKKSLDNK